MAPDKLKITPNKTNVVTRRMMNVGFIMSDGDSTGVAAAASGAACWATADNVVNNIAGRSIQLEFKRALD